MEETRSRKRPRWRPLLAFGLAAVTISATTSYCWNRASGTGSHAAAKRLAWQGGAEERHQAIYELFDVAVSSIEELQAIAKNGSPREAQQASQALQHIRKRVQ